MKRSTVKKLTDFSHSKHFVVLIFVIHVYFFSNARNIANRYDSILQSAIVAEKIHFVNKIESRIDKSKYDSLILNIVNNKSNQSYNGNLYRIIVANDKEYHESFFIEDSVVTRLLLLIAIDTVADGTDEELFLLDLLTKECRPDYIKKYKSIIQPKFEKCIESGNQNLFLLYCNTLSKTEKDTILKCKLLMRRNSFLDFYTRGLLEDSCTVDSIKTLYRNATSYESIENYAQILKYVHSDTTVPEILMTQWCNRNVYGYVTSRVAICKALAHLFPENSIFKNKRRLFEVSDKTFALFYGKTKKEEILLRLKLYNKETIPDSLYNYEVVKKHLNTVTNWYNNKYQSKITCYIIRPYFKADEKVNSNNLIKMPQNNSKQDSFDTSHFKSIIVKPLPTLIKSND